MPNQLQFVTNSVLGCNCLPLCLWVGAEPGGDKLESKTEREPSIKKAYHLMMKKPLLTSPASTWREVSSLYCFNNYSIDHNVGVDEM